MSEAKPEPFAYTVFDERKPDEPTFVITKEAAREEVEWWNEGGFDAHYRPLYDADVPALVEALRRISALTCGVPGHTVAVSCGAREIARTALATLDTEEDSNAPS